MTYTYEVKPESYYEKLWDGINERFGGNRAIPVEPGRVKCGTCAGTGLRHGSADECADCEGHGSVKAEVPLAVEPKQEYDHSGRPVSPAIDPRWNTKAQYKPAKKVLGQQACRGRNYGRGTCEHCKDDYQKTKGNQRYCGKGGCQSVSQRASRDRKEAERRAYRAAHEDCPHSVTVRKSETRSRCQLCGRPVKV